MSKTTAVVLPAANAMIGRAKILAFTRNPDPILVAIFAAVGLSATILFAYCVILRFPDLGALIEQYSQF
jgi:hypothetical protein